MSGTNCRAPPFDHGADADVILGKVISEGTIEQVESRGMRIRRIENFFDSIFRMNPTFCLIYPCAGLGRAGLRSSDRPTVLPTKNRRSEPFRGPPPVMEVGLLSSASLRTSCRCAHSRGEDNVGTTR